MLRDFQEQIRGKIGRFRGIFAGKKSKFAQKWADFVGERQNSQKNRPISLDFSGKKSNFEGFSGQILSKIGRHGKFRGENSQETISKKQLISLEFFGKFR